MKRLIDSYEIEVRDPQTNELHNAKANVYEYEITYTNPGYNTVKTVQDLIFVVNGKNYGCECWMPA